MDNFVADAIFIDAPPAEVFAALLDPEEVLEWCTGQEAAIADTPGGEYTVQRADGSRVSGTISEYMPGERLVIDEYNWSLDDSERGPMVLTFTLQTVDDGTWIVVRQDGLDTHPEWQSFAESTRREWIRATVTLKRLVEGI